MHRSFQFLFIVDVDECQSSPCIHGVCSDLLYAYSCQCYPGYGGAQCQIGKYVKD